MLLQVEYACIMADVPFEERRWVEFPLQVSDFVVQVGPGGAAGLTAVGNDLPFLHEFTRLHYHRVQMTKIGLESIFMYQD